MGSIERREVLRLLPNGSLAASARCHVRSDVWLQQPQLAGMCDRFGTPLNLQFAKDVAIVPFDRVQGEEQPLANLLIREALRNEVEDF